MTFGSSHSSQETNEDPGSHKPTTSPNHQPDSATSLQPQSSEFMSLLSHELRNPLSSIVGYADLLIEDVKGDSQADARSIKKSAQAILNTVTNVSKFINVLEETPSLVTENCEIENLVQGVLASNPHPEINTKINTKDSSITTDSEHLKYIIEGILATISPSSQEEQATFTIKPEKTDDESGIRLLGHNPTKNLRPKDVYPLEQVMAGHKNLSDDFSDLGIRLAVTYELTKAIGGQVEFKTSAEEGTKVNIFIPSLTSTSSPAGAA